MLPPRSILAGVDFSDPSRTALRLAARLARKTEATLHVLHVEDPLLVAAAGQVGHNLNAETREELARFIDTVPEATACHPCLNVVVGGAAHGILTIAERESADLIVVSSHGMSGLGRVLFGSVAQQVLRQATRSVLIVPGKWTMPCDANDPGLGPIVVGIHGSETAIQAARAACSMSRVLNTAVEAVHVVPSLTVPERWRTLAESAIVDRVTLAERDITQFARLAVPALKQVTVRTGDIAEELARATAPDESRRPLLVLGRREPGLVDEVPGAIAERLALIAKVPVLMFLEPKE